MQFAPAWSVPHSGAAAPPDRTAVLAELYVDTLLEKCGVARHPSPRRVRTGGREGTFLVANFRRTVLPQWKTATRRVSTNVSHSNIQGPST